MPPLPSSGPPADGVEQKRLDDLEESEGVMEESRLVPVVKERKKQRKEDDRPQKLPRLQLVSLPR